MRRLTSKKRVPTLQQSLSSAVRNGFCQALPGVVTGALLFTALSASTAVGAAAGLAVAGGAAAIYGLGCNRPLPDGAFPAPPFSGGQCPIDYRVEYAFEYSINYDASTPTYTPGTSTINFVPGPISGARAIIAPNRSTGNIVIDRAGGTTAGFGTSGAPGTIDIRNVRITSVTPQSGGTPDNCGSLPPQVPSGITIDDSTVTNNITYTNNDGVDVTVPVVLAFGYANVDINGELNIPVAVQLDLNPVVNFNGQFNLRTGDFNVNLGNPDSPFGGNGPCGGDPVPDPDQPDPTLPLPPSDPIPPSNPDRPIKRKILRGCRVVTTVLNGKQTELNQVDNPDIYIPAIGYVNFLVQIGEGTAWTADIAVKNTNQIIECPWIGGAIDVRGTPSFNNNFIVSPIYTQQTFPAQYPPES